MSYEKIIRRHLNYDGENYRTLGDEELGSIVATHGTSIESASSLLFGGKFQKEHAILSPAIFSDEKGSKYDDEFYTTPNPRFGFDVDALDGEFDPGELAGVDAVLAGIQYAECAEDGYTSGVVVAFSGKLSLKGAQINTDPMFESNVEASNGIELVLPETPTIEVVAGIYPVDKQAEHDLKQAIKSRL